jgi:hypothetical protein
MIEELRRIPSQEVSPQSQPLIPSTEEQVATPLMPQQPFAAVAEVLLKRVEAAELGMRVPPDGE